MTEDEKKAELLERIAAAQSDPTRVKQFTRVTIRKFEGEDTSGEPVETVVFEDEGFAEAVRKGKENATD